MTDCPLPPCDIARPPSLPSIGKWMLDATLQPAHWLNEMVHGQRLREPINVVIVDARAESTEAAEQRLMASCARAGYPSREGHSSGYSGCIGGQLLAQLPAGSDHAFSDAPFVLDNNHGRIFGPLDDGGRFVFAGAFSREKVVPLAKIRHQYVSFDRARDDFTQRLVSRGSHRIVDRVALDNAPVDAAFTTGDHDGLAVVLEAVE